MYVCKDYLKKVFFIVCAAVFFVVICWFSSAFHIEGTYLPGLESEKVNQKLQSDMIITQEFRCMGEGLKQIFCAFENVHKNAGNVTITVLDGDKNCVGGPYTYSFDDFEQSEISLPLIFNEPLKLGTSYEIRWSTSEIDEKNPPEIVFYKSRGLSPVEVNGNRLFCKLYVSYIYEFYYDFTLMVYIVFAYIVILLACVTKVRLKEKYYRVAKEICLILFAILNCIMFDIANYGHVDFSLWRLVINSMPIYILERILLLLVNSLQVTGIVSSVFCFVLAVANHYVSEFRGKPIAPWDFGAIQTATSVVGSYSFVPTLEVYFAFLLLLFLVQASLFFKCEQKQRKSIKGFFLNCVIILFFVGIYAWQIYPKLSESLWAIQEVYQEEGIVAGFIAHCKYAKYDKPKGYSSQNCEEVLSKVELEEADASRETAQNIIVIMNESFADLRVIGENKLGGDYMPYIDSLSDNANVRKGNLYVSVFGGGTANTEFEALTGASCSYVPAVPYQTFINHDISSLPRLLKENGFYTAAFHPYLPNNWNRDKVYPYLGFDKYYSLDNMKVKEKNMLRWCVSDYSDYRKVIASYEKNKEQPFFMFNVTLQNHGGYKDKFDNFTNTVDLSKYGDFEEAETYLSLVKESDAQLEYLINYFSEVEEPTLICFFGDHQPCLETEFYEMLYGKALEDRTAEEKQWQYITPIVLWSNYEMELEEIDKISSNYLEALILKAANISMPAYESFLWQLYEEYPVVSLNGTWDSDGKYYESINEAQSDKLEEYSWLQYNRIKK